MIRIYPSVLRGSIKAPASKAHALRLMFAAAMASTTCRIDNIPECEDVNTAIDCLKAIGCTIEVKPMSRTDKRLSVKLEPFSKTATLQTVNFNFRQSATTARYMTAIASVFGIPANCRAEGNLMRRSQVSMTSRMAIRGAVFSNFSYPLELSGRLTGGNFELKGDEGSQFLCALITALPAAKDDSYIKLTSPLVDDTFVKMTIDILKEFEIKVETREDGYYIPGSQYYKAPKKLVCENDWGLSMMWTGAAAANAKQGGIISVSGLPTESHQRYRDAKSLFPLLSQDFTHIDIEAADCPNLATLFASFAIAKGASVDVSGIPQLKFKETNRLRSLGAALEHFGVMFSDTDDSLSITGATNAEYPEDMIIDTQNDPWLFMCMVLSSVAMKKPFIIKDEHGADKIYSDFLADFKSVGGKFEIVE